MGPIERHYTASIDEGDEVTLTFNEIDGQIKNPEFKVIGCYDLVQKTNELKNKFHGTLDQINIPPGTHHHDLLLRELVLKAKEQWPKQRVKKIVCPCGQLTVQNIHNRILLGARTADSVRESTYEGTQCSFCVPEINSLIKLRCDPKD